MSPEDPVETEVDRALDTLGIPRHGADGALLSQDDRLGLWVRDPARAPTTPSHGYRGVR